MEKLIDIANRAVADYGFRQAVLYGAADIARRWELTEEYIGSTVLKDQHENGVQRKLVGFTLPGRSAPRAGYSLLDQGETIGSVTSGSYSPTLDTSIGMGYVLERYVESDMTLDLDIRGRTVQVTVTELPFYTRQAIKAASARLVAPSYMPALATSMP